MILVKIWMLTDEGFERSENGLKEQPSDWVLKDAMIDPNDISHAYEHPNRFGCCVAAMKSGGFELVVQMTVAELHKTCEEYIRNHVVQAMFSRN